MLVDVLLVVGDQGLGDGLADGVDLGSVTTTADTDANVCFSLANNPNSYAFTPPEFRESLGLLSSTSPSTPSSFPRPSSYNIEWNEWEAYQLRRTCRDRRRATARKPICRRRTGQPVAQSPGDSVARHHPTDIAIKSHCHH